jgi:3-deoxy-D-manno-octulosonate 8-phosphate phosphatase (KDO 8-P phosphatase)
LTTPTQLRAIALDVDGVLTDGGFWWGANGEEFKRFHFLDVMGVARARRSGIRFALISGEDSPLVHRFAQKLQIEDVFAGCKDKATALRAFASRHGLELSAICFMGDDVNDLGAMAIAGIAAAPANAHDLVLAKVVVVTKRFGGNGAVRELIDTLAASGRLAFSYDTPAE